ncbi:hypothetical protein JOF29_007331 [Kribbella aluminosa]|uniref:Uncharacterized protein n=1 Tax=Kribbella aluminosa TaxID=416017 RepID=A0ABS4UX64_9ACTN|nr:hypothetical protein [Kribbella aluminosa]MBP2356221.1 hypothetical protein [Kribbella aluminosa]
MKGYLGMLAHFDALPAMLGTIPGWNSTLAIGIMVVVATSTYANIVRAIDDELRGA